MLSENAVPSTLRRDTDKEVTMEKKTIGKFIAVLRKANGLTQRELAEKLFVSDKTVSRWERDECEPELSLIPPLAEIFGITADELLRGERNRPTQEQNSSSEEAAKLKAKSEKQFRRMLDATKTKYRNFSLISVGLSVFGLFGAVVLHRIFYEDIIPFFFALTFAVASELCQICFATSARITPDEEDDTYTEKINKANADTVRTAISVSFSNLALIAFCLPIVTFDTKLGLEEWIPYGILFAVIALMHAYGAYRFLIYKHLCENGTIVLSGKEKAENDLKTSLAKKYFLVSVAIAIVLILGILLMNYCGTDLLAEKIVFHNCEDFKAYVEGEADQYAKEHSYGYTTKAYIENSDGEVICEYYYQSALYKSITFTKSDDKMPVKIVTQGAYNVAFAEASIARLALGVLIVVNFAATICFYKYQIKRKLTQSPV